VQRNVSGQGFMLDYDFVEEDKCCKRIWLCVVDLFLGSKEGGSSTSCVDLMSCVKLDSMA
jgi:hypothetical protein